ncbi:MAG TPA: type I DNA topoisomerase [Actinomycetota bacterium]|nr:type I DNA topoisomerase [Actinomycetota bacterium]
MAKTLVVVESPTKAKTLERYLGQGYTVRASYGHIRDLPKNKLGVDTERGFEPEYVVPEDSERAVRELRAAFRRAGDLVLATDFDREGEAIAYHVAEVLGVPPEEAKRVTFTEITRDAILEAFRNPRAIDLKLVEAQQARRILDRLVGYGISPILWKKVRPGLSAGRVQSVALRLIVDREREIRAFVPVEYWTIDARLSPEGDGEDFLARLVQVGEERLAASPDKRGLVLRTEAEAAVHAERLRAASYRVREVRERQVKRTPPPPFTTSTLQQEAARKLGFSARRTMTIAQQLYEGVDLPGEGRVGLITYMRTDSVNLAEAALAELAEVVRLQYGPDYALPKPRRYRTKARGAQEAHEAIRPTAPKRYHPDAIEDSLDRDQARLYRLIWQRAVASQMREAVFDQISVDVEATADGATYVLRATGQTLRFDGFRRVYTEGRDEPSEEDREALLPRLRPEQPLRLVEVLPEQHFTQPPPRYTEASLVKTLEELGIGRPSTYAQIISTLQERGYVRLEDRRFHPEDVGEVVTDLLVEFFPDIVDVNFTARMEEELDDIAEGRLRWVQVLDEFYGPFERLLEKNESAIERFEEELDELCPLCPQEGREPGRLVVKLGRHGKFIGCRNYPACRYTRDLDGGERPEPELTGEPCPECGRPLARKVGRFGPFVGCTGYPECRYVKREDRGTGVRCPRCGEGELVQKRARRGRRASVFYGCDRYPACDFTVGQRPLPQPCPSCGSLLVLQRDGSGKCIACGAVVEGAAEAAGLAEPRAPGRAGGEAAGAAEG